MGYAAIEQTIRERFEAQWPTSFSPEVPHIHDNSGQEPNKNSPFVRLTILQGDAFQVEMGVTRRWRRPGVVTVQIFIPVGQGTGDATVFGDTVRDIFEGRTISGVIFRATSVQRLGRSENWLQWNAVTPFQSDELR